MAATSLEQKVRTFLRKTAKDRVSKTVTADDIHRYLNKNNLNLTNSEKLGIINRVLQNNDDFAPAAYVRSSRPEARGRWITEWMYV